MGAARAINLGLSALGAAVFAALLFYVVLAPADFDQKTRDFALDQVEGRVDRTLSDISRSEAADRLSELAGALSDRLEQRIEQMRGALDAGLDAFIADVLAAACELDCERRDEAQQAVRDFFESTIARYGVALDRLQDIIVGEYQEIMDELRSDLTIFAASNLVALAFALVLAVFRGKAAAHLLPVSLALTGATVLAILWYALGQDWVMTIVFDDYWGAAYAAVLAVLALLMIDIAANRARVMTVLLNALGGAGGWSFSPC
jgi:hypothetical protein